MSNYVKGQHAKYVRAAETAPADDSANAEYKG